MKSDSFFRGVQINWSYGTQQNIGMNVISNLKIIIPELFKQQKIVNYLNLKTAQMDEIISKIQAQIDLLEEYRTALISNVVTGKIDVRGGTVNSEQLTINSEQKSDNCYLITDNCMK